MTKNITNNLNLFDMRVYQTNEIKNIALLGSAGSGKTTLAVCFLKLESSNVVVQWKPRIR